MGRQAVTPTLLIVDLREAGCVPAFWPLVTADEERAILPVLAHDSGRSTSRAFREVLRRHHPFRLPRGGSIFGGRAVDGPNTLEAPFAAEPRGTYLLGALRRDISSAYATPHAASFRSGGGYVRTGSYRTPYRIVSPYPRLNRTRIVSVSYPSVPMGMTCREMVVVCA